MFIEKSCSTHRLDLCTDTRGFGYSGPGSTLDTSKRHLRTSSRQRDDTDDRPMNPLGCELYPCVRYSFSGEAWSSEKSCHSLIESALHEVCFSASPQTMMIDWRTGFCLFNFVREYCFYVQDSTDSPSRVLYGAVLISRHGCRKQPRGPPAKKTRNAAMKRR